MYVCVCMLCTLVGDPTTLRLKGKCPILMRKVTVKPGKHKKETVLFSRMCRMNNPGGEFYCFLKKKTRVF